MSRPYSRTRRGPQEVIEEKWWAALESNQAWVSPTELQSAAAPCGVQPSSYGGKREIRTRSPFPEPGYSRLPLSNLTGFPNWWRVRATIPLPRRCHRRALPIELTPRRGSGQGLLKIWWRCRESNSSLLGAIQIFCR